MQQPQEIEVWFILPALRRELARIITEKHGLSQKEAANILNVSEPAISQYKKSKRAKEVKFTDKTMQVIEDVTERIIKDKSSLIKEMQRLCDEVKKDLTLCKIHKSKADNIPSGCHICLKGLK